MALYSRLRLLVVVGKAAARSAAFLMSAVASLSDLALSSLADSLAIHYALVGSLACVPTKEAQVLIHVGDLMSSEVTPPVELLRTFYGGSLERLRQVGATDDWLSETLGLGGLRRLSHLSLSLSRLSAFGAGHFARALPWLRELRLSRCRGLTAACLVEIGRCSQLEWLGVTECELALQSGGFKTASALRSARPLPPRWSAHAEEGPWHG